MAQPHNPKKMFTVLSALIVFAVLLTLPVYFMTLRVPLDFEYPRPPIQQRVLGQRWDVTVQIMRQLEIKPEWAWVLTIGDKEFVGKVLERRSENENGIRIRFARDHLPTKDQAVRLQLRLSDGHALIDCGGIVRPGTRYWYDIQDFHRNDGARLNPLPLLTVPSATKSPTSSTPELIKESTDQQLSPPASLNPGSPLVK